MNSPKALIVSLVLLVITGSSAKRLQYSPTKPIVGKGVDGHEDEYSAHQNQRALTGTCTGDGCEVTYCWDNCKCIGDNCKLPTCYSNCRCEGSNCKMPVCVSNCNAKNTSSGLSGGAVGGMVVGIVVGSAVLIGVFMYLCCGCCGLPFGKYKNSHSNDHGEGEKVSFPVQAEPAPQVAAPVVEPHAQPLVTSPPTNTEPEVPVVPTVPIVPVPPTAEATSSPPVVSADTGEPEKPASAAERLKELEGIKDMIGEEAYNAKKAQILESI